MSQRSQRTDGFNESHTSPDGFPYKRPQIHLLNDSQWLFVRKYFHISPRELEVAKLVCGGYSNDEIAKLLKIKCATVKTHLRNVYRRIHVQRKLDMLLKFLEQSAVCTGAGTNVPLSVIGTQNPLRTGFGPEITGKEPVADP
jgi:DNA-binding CsgD family transcriptional regulator